MHRFTINDGWLTIYLDQFKHISEDIVLLQVLRSVVFRQMLEPFRCDGTHTVVEGRPMIGAQHRLESLGFKFANTKLDKFVRFQ